jgi:hypothetical protein
VILLVRSGVRIKSTFTLGNIGKTAPNEMLDFKLLVKGSNDFHQREWLAYTFATSATFFPCWISFSLFKTSCQFVTENTAYASFKAKRRESLSSRSAFTSNLLPLISLQEDD